MKAYVIAIEGHAKSQQAADRCIESGKLFGVDIQKFDAVTPEDDIESIAAMAGVPLYRFVSKYSPTENALAAFMSHYSLWNLCAGSNEPIAIFEHDAVLTSPLPQPPMFVGNIGKPSYGKFNTPTTLGWGDLVSKPYFPGAHAYIVTPMGARMLIEKAVDDACTTDVYLDTRRFPWLQEYYPWVAEARDTFSTIQNENGCRAKHNYNSDYEYVER